MGIRREGTRIPSGTLGSNNSRDGSGHGDRSKSLGIGNRDSRASPDYTGDGAVSDNSRRSAAVANLFGGTPDKSNDHLTGARSQSMPPARAPEPIAHKAPSTASIYENKAEYLKQKRQEELARLEVDVQKLKEKLHMTGNEYEGQIMEYKERNR